MSDKITLPGSIPGLLRRCSPVINTGVLRAKFMEEGIIVSRVERRKGIEVAFDNDESLMSRQEQFALDLEDPTGRQHAIWWLAENAISKAGKLAFVSLTHIRFATGWYNRWNLMADDFRNEIDGTEMISFWKYDGSLYNIAIESLKDLDSGNETKLGDGSLWVDAEALRRICLHVAKERGML